MGLTFVQLSTDTILNSTSVSKAYPSDTTLGSLLLCHGNNLAGGATFGVTDTLGNTWTQLGHTSPTGGSPAEAAVFFAINVGFGPNTITWHSTVSGSMSIFAAEYTGQAIGANPIDQILGDDRWFETGTGTVNFGSITTTATNETLIFFGRQQFNSNMTAQDGSTVRSLGGTSKPLLQDRDVAAIGAYPCSFSTTFSGNQGEGTFFSVKTPASVTPTPPPPVLAYSVPDDRNFSVFPNASENIQGTLIYDVPAQPSTTVPVDSRASKPVDSRTSDNIPTNSRTPGTYGPGE